MTTELCKIMKNSGSDKGDDWHNYTLIYDYLFSNKRQEIKNVFELGIGSTNSKILSHMKSSYKPGGSLRGWREYFPNADIFAADIDRDILQAEERIQKFYVDQTNNQSIFDLWDNAIIPNYFDIIIDDGLHDFPANENFFLGSVQKIDINGIYIIEDIPNRQADQFKNQLGAKSLELGMFARLIKIKHKSNNHDNILMCFAKLNSEYHEKIKLIPAELLNE